MPLSEDASSMLTDRKNSNLCRVDVPPTRKRSESFSNHCSKLKTAKWNLTHKLSSHLREPHNNAYITPGLEALIDIQKTSDIFFPGKWCSALLGNHKSKEAKKMVEDFLASHKDYPLSLKNKILQESFSLFNEDE